MARFRPAALDWLRRYDGRTAGADGLAAVIVTIMLVPQSLAYAMLAGLPPAAGLYASILPLIAYAALSGYAQVYTGNHYPSDVLGGWTLGYVVARLAIRYDRAIQKHCSWLSQTVVFRTREGWGVGWVCGPVSAP